MGRRVKEFVDVADHASIDELIAKLTAIRAELPEEANAELQLLFTAPANRVNVV